MAKQTILQGHDVCIIFAYDETPVPTLCKIREVAKCEKLVHVATNGGYDFRLSADEFVTLLFDRKVIVGNIEITLIND